VTYGFAVTLRQPEDSVKSDYVSCYKKIAELPYILESNPH